MSQAPSSEQSGDRLFWRPAGSDLLAGDDLRRRADAVRAGRPGGCGVLVLDGAGRIVAADALAASILGLSIEGLLERTSQDPRWKAVSAQGLPLVGDQQAAMRALATGEPVEGFLMGVLVPDRDDPMDPGETRWIEVDALPVRSASGGQLGVITFFHDVSSGARGRRATKALIRSYRLLAENASDIVLMSSGDSRITWVSSSLTRLLGWAPEDFVGRQVAEFLHAHDQAGFAAVQSALARGEQVAVDGRVRTADGRYRWMAGRIRPVVDDGGAVVGKVLSLRDVDAEQRAVEALRESEERLRLLAENADDVIWTMDLNGSTTYVSPSVERLLGFAPEEVRLQSPPPMHAVSQTLWQEYWSTLQAAIERGDPPPAFAGDIHHVRKDGSDMIGEVRVVPQLDEAGRVVRLLGVTRDVTQLRRAAQDAARSRAELAEAQRLATVGSFTWDSVNEVVVWSDELRSIYGLGPDDPLPSVERARFFGPETSAELQRAAAQCLALGDPYEIECDIVRRDGTVRHLLSRGEPVRNVAGEIVGLRGTVADITERQRAQADIERSREELAEAQRVAKVGSWRLDARTGLATWSEETGRISGVSHALPWGSWEEARVFYGYVAQLVDPATVEALRARDERSLATGEPYELEYDLHRPDGVDMRILARTMAVRDASGAIIGLRGTIADITELHRAAEALRASEARARGLVEQLRQADAAKNHFISTLSHELRNPLASIKLALEQLREDPQAGWAFDIVDRQSQHLSRLVDDLLDVTRLTRNTIVLKTEPVGLNALVQTIARDNQSFFDDRAVVLEARIASTPLLLLADPARLVQAIGNLLHNAAKFSDAGGVVTLDVDHDPAAGEAVVTVTDRGRGIPADVLPNLFQPFTQVGGTFDRGQGGLGLGLSIVRQIAELHGGMVTAESDGPGTGSRFTLRLPLSQPADATPAPASTVMPPASQPSGEGDRRRLRVLLIEDDPDLQQLTALQMKQHGHDVVAVGSGPDGIAAARRERFDVIVCDIGLPGMDGYAVARALRADGTVGSIPLIAVTGYGQPADVERARVAGFDHHLVKPVDVTALEVILADPAVLRGRTTPSAGSALGV